MRNGGPKFWQSFKVNLIFTAFLLISQSVPRPPLHHFSNLHSAKTNWITLNVGSFDLSNFALKSNGRFADFDLLSPAPFHLLLRAVGMQAMQARTHIHARFVKTNLYENSREIFESRGLWNLPDPARVLARCYWPAQDSSRGQCAWTWVGLSQWERVSHGYPAT